MCDCDLDYESPSVYNETEPIAKKRHRCCECRRTIEVAEWYRRIEGCWGGNWCTYKTCRHCVAAIETIKAIRDCFCPSIGNAILEFSDNGFDDGEGSMPSRMYHSMRHQWKYRRGTNKGRMMPMPIVPERKSVASIQSSWEDYV